MNEKSGEFMSFCIECGTKLELKELPNEGLIPFCKTCQTFRFKQYNVAVSMVVVSPDYKRVLLIEQYGKKRWILVAGYVNCGEAAEEACKRELMEEVSLSVKKLIFQKSKYFEKTNTLMLNYIVVADTEQVIPNHEVDSFKWFTVEEGRQQIAGGSLAEEFYLMFYERVINDAI